MKITHTIAVFLCYLVATSSLFGQQLIDARKSAEIDAYIEREMTARKIPGLALGIASKGKIIKQNGYGVADIQHQVTVTPSTVFELASITKQFTASAIMILVQDGKLALESEIHDYLPDAPENWKGITIRHLLNHSSGLPFLGDGFTGFQTMESESLLRLFRVNFTSELAYEAAKADTLTFTPGDSYVYSDVGYFLLGLIVEKASGISYRDFMQKRIFDTVAMNDTYILDQVTIHPNEARGYTLRDGELVNIRRIWEFEVPSHYGIFSTVGDLIKWDTVLNTQKILSNESKEEMFSLMLRNNGTPYPYGYGWSVWNRGTKKIIDHTGVTGTQFTKFLDDEITVVVLTNLGRSRAGGDVNSWGIGPEIAHMLGLQPYIDEGYRTLSGAKVVKTSNFKQNKIKGIYTADGQNTERKIYSEDNKLIYDNGSNKSELVLLDDGRYLMLGTTEEWILKPAENGKKNSRDLSWLLNEQVNGKMRFKAALENKQ